MKVKDLFWILVLGGGALFAFDKYKAHQTEQTSLQETQPVVTHQAAEPTAEDRSWIKPRDAAPAQNEPTSQFKCDGRTHCSQMTSCAEAEYFLKHCPNTQMDGNNDGEPCEKQWCN